jgi:uncharacterized protein (DUF433 family)
MEYFTRSPQVCNGNTVFKGTRVPLRVVLDSLAEGATVQEILESYPSIKADDIQAAIAFVASGARDDESLPVSKAD